MLLLHNCYYISDTLNVRCTFLFLCFAEFISVADGHLTKAEFEAHVGLDFLFKEPLFNHFDGNKDGVLDKTEFVDVAFQSMNHNRK
jgi:hypothetical protein